MQPKFEQLRNSNNVKVGLMVDFLVKATKSLEQGKLSDACTCIRLAKEFQDEIPAELRLLNQGDI